MRGMVFGQDADKLIVAATPAEVRQYGVGQAVNVDHPMMEFRRAVDVMYEHGYDFSRREEWIPYSQTGPKGSYEVLLRTACGCERHYATDRRIDRLRVPVYGNMSLADDSNSRDLVMHGSREFIYRGTQVDRHGKVRLLYVEAH